MPSPHNLHPRSAEDTAMHPAADSARVQDQLDTVRNKLSSPQPADASIVSDQHVSRLSYAAPSEPLMQSQVSPTSHGPARQSAGGEFDRDAAPGPHQDASNGHAVPGGPMDALDATPAVQHNSARDMLVGLEPHGQTEGNCLAATPATCMPGHGPSIPTASGPLQASSGANFQPPELGCCQAASAEDDMPAVPAAKVEGHAHAEASGLKGLEPQAQAAQLAVSAAAPDKPAGLPGSLAATTALAEAGLLAEDPLASAPESADPSARQSPHGDNTNLRSPMQSGASNVLHDPVKGKPGCDVSTPKAVDGVSAGAGGSPADGKPSLASHVHANVLQAAAAGVSDAEGLGSTAGAACRPPVDGRTESMTDSTNNGGSAFHTPKASSETASQEKHGLSQQACLPIEQGMGAFVAKSEQPEPFTLQTVAAGSGRISLSPMRANTSAEHGNDFGAMAPDQLIEPALQGRHGLEPGLSRPTIHAQGAVDLPGNDAAKKDVAEAQKGCAGVDGRDPPVGGQSRLGAAALHEDRQGSQQVPRLAPLPSWSCASSAHATLLAFHKMAMVRSA